MRIIGGTHRSRRINAPKDLPLRPTTDFAKESLFNILQNKIDLDGITVLDLFSGTGAISLEFASRGAANVLSIDKLYTCSTFLKSKAAEFKFNQIHAFKNEAMRFLESNTMQFDVIFADPPYEYGHFQELVSAVFDRKSLKPNGLLVVEHDSKTSFKEREQFLEHRKSGEVNFSFFINKQHE